MKKDGKKGRTGLCLLMVLLMTVTGMSFTASAATLPFKDVNPSNWFFDGVREAYGNGLMLGTSDNTFSPELPTSRGMIVTILHRMEGVPQKKGASFSDVPAGQWFSAAVSWASANDIVNGYGDGKFGPNDPITREQMAAILYRYSKYRGYNMESRAELSAFTDKNRISSYAVESLSWANALGLITGVTETTLQPQGQATRAQAATILTRYMKQLIPKIFTDFYTEQMLIPVGETKDVKFYAQVDPDAVMDNGIPVELYDSADERVASMRDDGTEGDSIANDGIYTAVVPLESDVQAARSFYSKYNNSKSVPFEVSFYLDLSGEELNAGDDVMEQLFAIAEKYPVTGNEEKDAEQAKSSYGEMIRYLSDLKAQGKLLTYSTEGEVLQYVMPGNLEYMFQLNGLLYDESAETAALQSGDGTADLFGAVDLTGGISKIAALEPFHFQHPTAHIRDAAQAIVDTGLSYTFGEPVLSYEADVDCMKNLAQYHVILLDSHGGKDSFATGQQQSYVSNLRFNAQMQAGQIKICGVSGVENREFYCVTDKFISAYYHGKNRFDDSLIYIGTCHGADSSGLSDAFLNGGAQTVLAFTNSVDTDYAEEMCEVYVRELCSKKDASHYRTAAEALDRAKNTLGKTDMEESGWFGKFMGGLLYDKYPAELKLFGNGNFTIEKTRGYTFFGDAAALSDGSIELTPLDTWRGGSIWFPQSINTDQGFTVEFSYWAGGGRDKRLGGADGLVCCISDKPGLGARGQDLGFVGGNTYGVEFDPYHNSGDPAERHVGIIHGRASNHLATLLTDKVDDSSWHRVKVTYANGTLTAVLDGAETISSDNVVLEEDVYLGFSAATGDGQNRHVIRDITVSIP